MNVLLIEPSFTINNIGIRTISSCLKQSGHNVSLLFQPQFPIPLETVVEEKFIKSFSAEFANVNVIGISVVTIHYYFVKYLISLIHRAVKAKIVLGGIHATVSPDTSLEIADMICVGEGEDAIVDLVNKIDAGKSIDNIPNIWQRNALNIVKNPVRVLCDDLDVYPFQDYDIEAHFIGDRVGNIGRMQFADFKRLINLRSVRDDKGGFLPTYHTIWSRGCPHSCSYCCNSAYLNIYGKQWRKIRRRSFDHLFSELNYIKKRFSFIKFMMFVDDEFLATSTENIQTFCQRYKEEIGLPFKCHVSPSTITKDKMEALFYAGLSNITIGIESGSERVSKEIYKRYISKQTIINAANIINHYKDDLRPRYDLIMDNPYENDVDLLECIELLSRLPKPFRIATHSLAFYPGTDLYKNALKDGLINDDENNICNKKMNTLELSKIDYIKLVLLSTPFLPTFIIHILKSRMFLLIFNRHWLKVVFKYLVILARKVNSYTNFNSDRVKQI